ncbi:MAG: signal peptide peptidase SppA [Phycisphaerae bacterium]|jgi:protease-4
MNKRNWIVAASLLACLAGCSSNTGYVIKPVPMDQTLKESTVSRDPGLLVSRKIVIIDVDGLIMNDRGGGLWGTGENPVSLFVEKIKKAEADPAVCAIVLRINSPGGGVTASDIMYEHLKRAKTARKLPVVAVIEDVGASGAYYLACGSDAILAHPTSITGSIGVIVQLISLDGTLHKLGIDTKAITSGRFKDMASPFKKLDPEDEALLQGVVNSYYERFLKVVEAGRPKLSKEAVRQLADGRVYTGDQALANGLVDSLGYVDDAVSLARKLSGQSRVNVVIYHRPIGYKSNIYSTAPDGLAGSSLAGLGMQTVLEMVQPQFLYLWTAQTPRK